MAEGTIDFLPELVSLAAAYLPREVTVVSQEPYGGAIRMKISGDGIDDGATYQLIITDEPMRRVIELRKNG